MLPFEQLTEREQEVLALVALGYENKAIARELNISISTVQNHLQNLYMRLDVRNRTEAASKYWQRQAQAASNSKIVDINYSQTPP